MEEATCTNCNQVFDESELTLVIVSNRKFRECPRCHNKHNRECARATRALCNQKSTRLSPSSLYHLRDCEWSEIPEEKKQEIFAFIKTLNIGKLKFRIANDKKTTDRIERFAFSKGVFFKGSTIKNHFKLNQKSL